MNDTMDINQPSFRYRNQRLPPEVNRILYVKNLPWKIKDEELYEVFGKYGGLRQIRRGSEVETRGTAFVVYEDIFEAKNALEGLSGYNVMGRYLIVLYYNKDKFLKKLNEEKERKKIAQLRKELADKQRKVEAKKKAKEEAKKEKKKRPTRQ